MGNKLVLKHFRNAFIFGFLVETMIIKSKICNNKILYYLNVIIIKFILF